jgi:RNA polymerase sigma-70 factor, ECF subfamily
LAFFHKQKDNLVLDDETLVRRSQHGDPEAMTCLIVKYQDRVYNSILKICSNPDDAAELTQDTFVKVLESIGTFRGQSAFYTWLFRVALNLTLNHCRRRFKLSPISLDTAGEINGREKEQLAAMLSDPEQDDPAQIAQQKELVRILLDLIARLNEEHRIVLVLRDIEQMSYTQIAEVLELEPGTVKSRLSRARSALRELLETVLT